MRVLVTGAAGGIGSATAAAFEDGGHRVWRHDMRAGDNVDIVGDLLAASDLDHVREVVKKQNIDAIVATHGIAGAGALDQLDGNSIRRIMRVNTISVLALYDAVSPILRQRAGVFVAVSSQAGLMAEAQNSIYSASKFALVGWAEGVARANRFPRMRIICPGMIETQLLVDALKGMAESAGRTYEDFLEWRLADVPVGRLGRTEEIGGTALWLATLTTEACVVAEVTGGAAFY